MFDFSRFPILITERLRLRQLTHDDAEGMRAMLSSEEVLRFLNLDPVDTPGKAISLIDWLNEQYEQQNGINWAITLADDGRLIGSCGGHSWNRGDRHIDIGYQLLPAYWGGGYATEAARAIIGWLFENLDLHRIQADCTDGNIASERVLLKCGFSVEGIWREQCWEHERWVDIKQFGLLRKEFEHVEK